MRTWAARPNTPRASTRTCLLLSQPGRSVVRSKSISWLHTVRDGARPLRHELACYLWHAATLDSTGPLLALLERRQTQP